jgi:hypothetical protein
MGSLLSLLDVHADLKERLAVHADLVVGLEFARAFEELERFERELRAHMDAEERHILPVYRVLLARVPGGDPDLFILEHRNILRNLAMAKEALLKVMAIAGAGRREAHLLLDQEWILRHLLEHHDAREKNVLYPRLDAALAEEQRDQILAAVSR